MAPPQRHVVSFNDARLAVHCAARAASHAEEDDQEEWADDMLELLIGPGWFKMWPAGMREDFLQDMLAVQRMRYLPPAKPHSLGRSSITLEHMRMSFCRVEYIIKDMARHPPGGANPLGWAANVHRWFKENVLDYIDEPYFNGLNAVVRTGVVEDFDLLAHYVADGRLRRLPSLHEEDEDAEYDPFLELRGVLAHLDSTAQRRADAAHAGRASQARPAVQEAYERQRPVAQQRRRRKLVARRLGMYPPARLGGDEEEEEDEDLPAFSTMVHPTRRASHDAATAEHAHGPVYDLVMRSLSRQGAAGVQLTERQRAVYGRRW
ncbi:hypothetical protein JCM9279_005306 [Rhodotorula babjevae]